MPHLGRWHPSRLRLLGVALFAVLVVWACDGHNLFGPGVRVGPSVLELTAPASVDAGEEFTVGVRAAAQIRLDSVVVEAAVGEDVATDVVEPESEALDVQVEALLEAPEVIADTVLTITARAVDVQGNRSRPETRHIRVVDLTPPDARVTLSRDEVALGRDVEIEVEGEDNIGVATLGFQVLDAEGDTVARVRDAADGEGGTASRTFTFTVPETLGLGDFLVEGIAHDLEGNVGTAAAGQALRVIFVDDEPPAVTITSPSSGRSVQAREDVILEARVRDDDGVARVVMEGVALRGDPDLGTDEVVEKFQPRTIDLAEPSADTTLARLLEPTEEVTPEEVALIVTAEDSSGNVAADTVAIQLTAEGMPFVSFIEPEDGAGVPLGDSLFVAADVGAPLGIASVTFDGVAHRGDPSVGTDEVVQRFQPRTVDFGGAVSDTTLMRWLQATGEQVTETVHIRAVVEDTVGNVVRDSVEITVGGPRVEVPDLEPGQTVSAGQDIQIRVVATDPQGIEVIEAELTGVVEETFQETVSGDEAEVSFPFTVPEDVSGSLNIRARARNTMGIEGQAPLVELNVTDEDQIDTTPPEVRIEVAPQGPQSDPNRIEGTDPVEISVVARDNTGGTGVKKAGYSVRIVRRQNPADTLWITDEVVTAEGVGSTVTRLFDPTMLEDFVDSSGEPFYDPVNRPDTLDLDFFGWAEDDAEDEDGIAAPNCAAAVASASFQQLDCETVHVDGTDFLVADGELGQEVTVAVVSGETVRLPEGGSIADAVVDPDDTRRLLFLSNIGLSRLEVFDLENRTFESPVLVGAEPWGMTFGLQDQDSLYVGNSGGTNISVVDVPGRQEVLSDRVLTPNTVLWDVEESTSDGGVTIEWTAHDFSDRPQFVAQDKDGRLVYSTRPTGSAPDGTIRVTDTFDDEVEVYLFTDYARTEPADGTYALSNVDDFTGEDFSAGAGVIASRLRPYRDGVIDSDTIQIALGATPAAVTDLRDKVQTHLDGINYAGAGASSFPATFLPRARTGEWDLNSVGLTDTTFIASAGDGSVVAIGEGATAETGRVFLWKADPSDPEISSAVAVTDLVSNASQRILGVDMNFDGSMGVGRGDQEVFYFDDDLRHQGTSSVEAGGTGVALHPLHSDAPIGTERDVALAFVPVGGGHIDIYSTLNFNRIGRVHIRQDIVGPVRASLPYSSDNAGLTCATNTITSADNEDAVAIFNGPAPNDDSVTEAACTVVKLSAISADGGVVVIDVTKEDVFREFH